MLEPVARAIAIVEALEEGDLLFTCDLYRGVRPAEGRTALTSEATVERIRVFIAWVNDLAAADDRGHEHIPSDPEGAITLRRFRRTMQVGDAWQVPAGGNGVTDPYRLLFQADRLPEDERRWGTVARFPTGFSKRSR